MMYENLWMPEPNSGCWLWTASLNSAGRPRVSLLLPTGKTKTRMAYRVICEAVNGPVPAGKECSHLCHNLMCVNPDHVIYETRQENLKRRDQRMARPGSIGVLPSGNWRARRTILRDGKYTRINVGVFARRSDAVEALSRGSVALPWTTGGGA